MTIKESIKGLKFQSIKYGSPMGKIYIAERVYYQLTYINIKGVDYSTYEAYLQDQTGTDFKLSEVAFV